MIYQWRYASFTNIAGLTGFRLQNIAVKYAMPIYQYILLYESADDIGVGLYRVKGLI